MKTPESSRAQVVLLQAEDQPRLSSGDLSVWERMHSPRRRGIRILIADDERLFREALRVLLETEGGFRVVAGASDGVETVHMVRRLKPDILLLDLAMPGLAGLDALRALASGRLGVRTLVLTGGITREDIIAALQLGARGVVLKDAAPELLFRSIRAVF